MKPKNAGRQADAAWNFETPEEWRKAVQVCRECKNALDTEHGIRDGYVEYNTPLRQEADKLIERFGGTVLTQVITDTLRENADDGRYESRVINWAKMHQSFPPIPGRGYGPDGPLRFVTSLHPEYVRAAAYTLIAIEREQAKQAEKQVCKRSR